MKNQTLEIGSYLIPEGCKAVRMGGEVIISINKDNRIKEGDWRCKDCILRQGGKDLYQRMVYELGLRAETEDRPQSSIR
jgi:hypothetical protein